MSPTRARIGRGAGLAAKLGGSWSGGQFGAFAQDHGAFDVVLQLADVPGPVVFAQQAHGLAVDGFDLAAVLVAVTLEEEGDELRDVVAALAEGGQINRHDVQAVIQVFTEAAGADLLDRGRGWWRR